MDSVIKDLYEGKLCPIGQYSQLLQRFRKKWRETGASYDGLREKLDTGAEEEMEGFLDKYWELIALELEQSFSNGFTLGVKMMCEVFMLENVEKYLEKLEKGDV